MVVQERRFQELEKEFETAIQVSKNSIEAKDREIRSQKFIAKLKESQLEGMRKQFEKINKGEHPDFEEAMKLNEELQQAVTN